MAMNYGEVMTVYPHPNGVTEAQDLDRPTGFRNNGLCFAHKEARAPGGRAS